MRAFAVTVVAYFHSTGIFGGYPSYPGSPSGLDLFFVISGFVVTQSFLRGLNRSPNARLALIQFYVRRFFRIVPLAAFWIIYVYFAATHFNGTQWLGDPRQILYEI